MSKKFIAMLLALSVQLAVAGIPVVSAEAPRLLYYDDFSESVPTQGEFGKSFTAALVTRSKDADFPAGMDDTSAVSIDGPGVLSINGSGAGGQAGADFVNPGRATMLYDFAQTGSSIALEVKLKISAYSDGINLFLIRDNGGPSNVWGTNQTTGYLMNATSEGKLVFNHYNGSGTEAVEVGTYTPGEWVHIVMLLTVEDGASKNVSANVYANGEKNHTGSLRVNTGACTGFQNLVRFEFNLSGTKAWMDDFIARTVGDLQLQSSTVNRSNEGSLDFYMGFNLPVDKNSLSNISVRQNGASVPYTAEIIAEDANRVKVSVAGAANEDVTSFAVDYTGISDVLGQSASGIIEAVGPRITSTVPERGAVGVSVKPTVTINYNKEILESSFNPSEIQVSGGTRFSAALSANHRSIDITFANPLLAGEEYTVTFSDGITDGEGLPIAPADREFKFTTDEYPSKIVSNISSAADGVNYVVEKAGLGGPENGHYLLDDFNEGHVLYHVEDGIYSFELYTFVSERAAASLVFLASGDGVDYTEISTTSFTDSGKIHPDWESAAVVRTNRALPDGTTYLMISVRRPSGATAVWGTMLNSVNLNCSVPPKASLVSSTPKKNELKQEFSDKIQLDFTNMMHVANVDFGKFSINGGISVTDANVNETGKSVTLQLNKAMEPFTKYTLSIDGGIEDLYGQITELEPISFITKPQIELLGAAIKSGSTEVAVLPASGTITPTVTLKNTAPNGHALIMACLYNGKVLEGFSLTEEANIPQSGEYQVTLDDIAVPSAGCVLKIYILNSGTAFRPISNVIRITNTGIDTIN